MLKMANNIRYYGYYDKRDETVCIYSHKIGDVQSNSFESTAEYATRSYIRKERAMIAIMHYFYKNKITNIKFVEEQ